MADNPKSPLGHIQSVRVKFLKTGEYQELTFKDKSRCLFFMDTIDTDKEKVQLRLDFGDSCARGEPVLDADFYKNGKKVKRLKGERKKAHHTECQTDGVRTYAWKYGALEEPIEVYITWVLEASFQITMGISAEMELVRNNKPKS
ncbi:hypothetical protein ACXHQJ_22280 [Vibrio vulnificus]|nr:hypothetical protein [Vibrio vulnificus]